MKPQNYLKLSFGILLGIALTLLIIGGAFLFAEREKLKQENGRLKQEKLESLFNNKYSSLFAQVPEDWKTYGNEKYGFEIKYPSKVSREIIQSIKEELEIPEEQNIEILLEVDEGEVPEDRKIVIKGMEVEAIYTINFRYSAYENGIPSPTIFNPLFEFYISILKGNFTPEFLDKYISEFAFLSIKERDINYWGEEAKTLELKSKFIGKKITYLNNKVPIYEVYYPVRTPVIFDAFQKNYFIPYLEKQQIIQIGALYGYGIKEEIKNLLYLDKIVSTFKFLK